MTPQPIQLKRYWAMKGLHKQKESKPYHCTYCDKVFQNGKPHECNSACNANNVHGVGRQRDEQMHKLGVIDDNGKYLYPNGVKK